MKLLPTHMTSLLQNDKNNWMGWSWGEKKKILEFQGWGVIHTVYRPVNNWKTSGECQNTQQRYSRLVGSWKTDHWLSFEVRSCLSKMPSSLTKSSIPYLGTWICMCRGTLSIVMGTKKVWLLVGFMCLAWHRILCGRTGILPIEIHHYTALMQ
jgi:hypothetical protein